jgi:hypothetical protein
MLLGRDLVEAHRGCGVRVRGEPYTIHHKGLARITQSSRTCIESNKEEEMERRNVGQRILSTEGRGVRLCWEKWHLVEAHCRSGVRVRDELPREVDLLGAFKARGERCGSAEPECLG